MKLKNGEILNVKEPLAELLAEKLPVRVSYGLAKLAAKLEDQLQVIERVRQGLFKTYGEQDPDDQLRMTINPKSEQFPKFAEELGELLGQEVEIVIEPVQLPETLDIEPRVLMALEKFIVV